MYVNAGWLQLQGPRPAGHALMLTHDDVIIEDRDCFEAQERYNAHTCCLWMAHMGIFTIENHCASMKHNQNEEGASETYAGFARAS